jgi:hypothetical protein
VEVCEREYLANKAYVGKQLAPFSFENQSSHEVHCHLSCADRWFAFYEHTLGVRSAADYFVHIRRRLAPDATAIIDV